MVIEVKTENGSLYRLDSIAMTWERLVAGPPNKYIPVRTRSGKLTKWPRIKLNEPMVMVGPPLNPAADIRVIETSRVIEIEELNDRDRNPTQESNGSKKPN